MWIKLQAGYDTPAIFWDKAIVWFDDWESKGQTHCYVLLHTEPYAGGK
jgi:hypothetical protein